MDIDARILGLIPGDQLTKDGSAGCWHGMPEMKCRFLPHEGRSEHHADQQDAGRLAPQFPHELTGLVGHTTSPHAARFSLKVQCLFPGLISIIDAGAG